MTRFDQDMEFVTPEKLELRHLTKQIRGRMMRMEFMLETAAEMLAEEWDLTKDDIHRKLEEAWSSRKPVGDVPMNASVEGSSQRIP